MLNWMNILLPLSFFFLFYLFLQILKAIFFFIYLVQLKEYRFDRLKVHFRETKTGRDQIWQQINLLKWRRIYLPKFTLRAWLIVFLTFWLQYNSFFFMLRFSFRLCKGFPQAWFFILLMVLFLLNLITPLIVFLAVFISSLFFWPFRKMILLLAQRKINRCKNLLVIGVTGSYGKTAVKELLFLVLRHFFNVAATPANCNTLLGISLFILRKLKFSNEIFIVEMGAYKRGEIKTICRLVRPEIGIITGINQQHLSLFGSLNNIKWAKFELIKSLPKNGLAVFNANSFYSRHLFKIAKMNKKLYGQRKTALKTKLAGFWHQENLQAVLRVTDFLHLPRKKVIPIFKKLTKINLGLEISSGLKRSKIIDDSYNANPTGFLAALKLLNMTKRERKILITPGIIELGKQAERVHQEIGKEAGKICQKIFLTKVDFKLFLQKGLESKKRSQLIEFVENEVQLWDKLQPLLGPKTAILLEGRVPGLIVKKLKMQK